jgi:hypothetical protein
MIAENARSGSKVSFNSYHTNPLRSTMSPEAVQQVDNALEQSPYESQGVIDWVNLLRKFLYFGSCFGSTVYQQKLHQAIAASHSTWCYASGAHSW